MRHDHADSAELTLPSPIGPLTLREEAGKLVALTFADRGGRDRTDLLLRAAAQLDAYFDRRLQQFDLPLGPRGGDFQQRVWQALTEIPYGDTRTYGQISRQLGAGPVEGARAVGQACGANPIAIIVPCHRVLASNGSGGFSAPGGVDSKYKLLCLEGAALL